MNTTPRWRTLRGAMERQPVATSRRSPEDFWSDFRARVRLTRQEEPALRPVWRAMPFRLAYAAAAAVVLAAGVTLVGLRAPAVSNRIMSLQVVASHSGVIIMNDAAQRGTIVWITDLKTDDSG